MTALGSPLGSSRCPLVRRAARVGIASLIVLVLFGVSWIRVEDAAEASRTGGLIGAGWTYPTKASVDFGMIATRMPASFECRTPCRYHGVTVQGTAGLGGGELALGYGSLVGETGSGSWLLRRVFVGYGVRAAVVRTWGMSTLDPGGATFAGVEGAMTVAQFGVKLGIFRRVEPAPGQGDWRVFGGAGWGF
jgi:hypothetical protein